FSASPRLDSYPLSLHDALPILPREDGRIVGVARGDFLRPIAVRNRPRRIALLVRRLVPRDVLVAVTGGRGLAAVSPLIREGRDDLVAVRLRLRERSVECRPVA